MILAITGHRPNKFGPDGYKAYGPVETYIKSLIRTKLNELKPLGLISGMALGVDQWAAEVATELNIPFVAAIPCEGQENQWPKSSKDRYASILRSASAKFVISVGSYTPEVMQKRNMWMVDRSDALLAIWDGSPGGTGNCVQYAIKVGKPVHKVNPIVGL